MKTHYVYELFNLVGTIEYVGHTLNTKSRLYEHKSKRGKFHKRTDISMNIVKGFDTRKSAFAYQCELQKEYGLETDAEISSRIQKGKTLTEEHKQKISEGGIRRYSTTNV